MIIREAQKKDLQGLLMLYMQLHENAMPQQDEKLTALWESILLDANHHVLLAQEGEKTVSSCVLVIVPNLTHGQRPYALVENVITDKAYRKKGYASAVLNFARGLAEKENCYKIMLLTGSKAESTLNFYQKAGYNSIDKTAFIQWLNP